MDVPNANLTPRRGPSWWPVLLIVVIAIGLRVWMVTRSEVAARDSIGFIKYAMQFERESFVKVLREAEQPPGFPLAVMVASWPVRAWYGDTSGAAMALAAEIASAVFAVLLVLPMIGLGDELVSRRIGLLAAVLFQCLPSWVRITSDGLSESTFLFWSATTLWLAAKSLRTSSPWVMLAGGLTAGCAYFTRPEGAELVIATCIVIGLCAWLSRTTYRTAMLQAAALTVGFAVFLGPFFMTTGRWTNKPSARYLMGDEAAKKTYFSALPITSGPPLALWWNEDTLKDRNKWLWAIESLVKETVTSSRVFGAVLALVGLYYWSRRVRFAPSGWILIALCIMHSLLLIRLASALGYLSERHTALIIMTGCYPAALAINELACWMAVRRNRMTPNSAALVIVGVAFASALPSLSRPLHGNRAGHRAAGEWLAQHAAPSARICDPFCWAHYYAGRVFREVAQPDPVEQFVILENTDNQHSRLPLIPEAKAKAAAGELVYYWPEKGPAEESRVRIYRWLKPVTDPNANRSSRPTPAGG